MNKFKKNIVKKNQTKRPFKLEIKGIQYESYSSVTKNKVMLLTGKESQWM